MDSLSFIKYLPVQKIINHTQYKLGEKIKQHILVFNSPQFIQFKSITTSILYQFYNTVFNHSQDVFEKSKASPIDMACLHIDTLYLKIQTSNSCVFIVSIKQEGHNGPRSLT